MLRLPKTWDQLDLRPNEAMMIYIFLMANMNGEELDKKELKRISKYRSMDNITRVLNKKAGVIRTIQRELQLMSR